MPVLKNVDCCKQQNVSLTDGRLWRLSKLSIENIRIDNQPDDYTQNQTEKNVDTCFRHERHQYNYYADYLKELPAKPVSSVPYFIASQCPRGTDTDEVIAFGFTDKDATEKYKYTDYRHDCQREIKYPA